MISSRKQYHHNILKKAQSSYGSREEIYTECDSLSALKDELKEMEECLDDMFEDFHSGNTP